MNFDELLSIRDQETGTFSCLLLGKLVKRNVDGKYQNVIDVIVRGLEKAGEDFRLLILPDHPTPICVRTHTSDNVPYLLYDSTGECRQTAHYNEREAQTTGKFVAKGHELISHLFEEA